MIRQSLLLLSFRLVIVMSNKIDQSQVNHFFRNGWLNLPNLLPELLDDIYLHEIIPEARSYSDYSYYKKIYGLIIMQHQIKCSDYENSCGIIEELPDDNKSLIDTIEPTKLAKLTSTRIKSLQCCVDSYNTINASKRVDIPYYQSLNLHRFSSELYDLATSSKLGEMASNLLQESIVRLYQTALFEQDTQEFTNHGTAWHQDLNMVPLDTGHQGYVTFWCPLRTLSQERNDSMLKYATGSHRDISLIHWYPTEMPESQRAEIIYDRYSIYQPSVLSLGDCVAHHGWLYHSAPSQPINQPPRVAIAFSYVSNRACVLPDLHGNTTRHYRPFSVEDSLGYEDWINELEPMTHINHPLLPIVYSTSNSKSTSKSSQNNLMKKKTKKKTVLKKEL